MLPQPLPQMPFPPQASPQSEMFGFPPQAAPVIPDLATGGYGSGPRHADPVPQTPIQTSIDSETNWASHPEVHKYVMENIFPILSETRMQRETLEAEWIEIRKMRLLQHSVGQSYNGRSNAYVPVYKQAARTLVSQLTRGLFPSDDYVQAEPLDGQTKEEALAVTRYVKWELEQNAHIRLNIKPAMREYTDYGLGVVKTWFNKTQRSPLNKKRGPGALNKVLNMMHLSFDRDNTCDGVAVSARSAFHFYVFPWTADTLKQAQVVFEDMEVSQDFVRSIGAAENWLHVDEVVTSPEEPEGYRWTRQEQLTSTQGNPNLPNDVGAGPRAMMCVITEAWASIPLPKESKMNGEDPDSWTPVVLHFNGKKLMSVKRNPFWHQKPPYAVAQAEREPGSFYSRGNGHTGLPLQQLANDFYNQLCDYGTYALNPMWERVTTMINGNTPKIRPGVIFDTMQSGSMRPLTPDAQNYQYGERSVRTVISMMNDFLSVPPVVQGSGTGGAAGTATGAQILNANASAPLQDSVEELEIQFMVEIGEMTYYLGQQYRSGDILLQVAGQDIKMNADELWGRYHFRWLASSQATAQAQRVRQVMMLLQQLLPWVPLIQQSGYKLDIVPLVQKVYSDGFGFRGFEEFIHKMSPEEMMQLQMQMMQQQSAGGAGAVPPSEDVNARSANDVTNGANGPMTPGEGEAFADVRDGADQLSAEGGEGGGY